MLRPRKQRMCLQVQGSMQTSQSGNIQHRKSLRPAKCPAVMSAFIGRPGGFKLFLVRCLDQGLPGVRATDGRALVAVGPRLDHPVAELRQTMLASSPSLAFSEPHRTRCVRRTQLARCPSFMHTETCLVGFQSISSSLHTRTRTRTARVPVTHVLTR